MKRKKGILRIVSFILCITFLWTNCVWAVGVCVVDYEHRADKLAVRSELKQVGQALAKNPKLGRLILESELVKEFGFRTLRDVVAKMPELEEKGVICFIRTDRNGKEARYIFGEDGIILRVTKEQIVKDDFYKLLGVMGEKEIVGEETYEWLYVTDESVELINSFLQKLNPNWSICISAVEALVILGRISGLEYVINELSSSSNSAVNEARRFLEKLGYQFMDQPEGLIKPRLVRISTFRTDAGPYYPHIVKDGEAERYMCKLVKGAIEVRDIQVLESALKDENWSVRISAAEVLVILGEDSGLEYLINELSSHSDSAVNEARSFLEKLGYQFMDRPDGLIKPRLVRISTFGTISGPRYYFDKVKVSEEERYIGKLVKGAIEVSDIQVLESALKDKNWDVRISAAEALVILGEDSGLEYLIKELSSTSDSAVNEARRFLEKLGYQFMDRPEGLIKPRLVRISTFRTAPGPYYYFDKVKVGEEEKYMGKLVKGAIEVRDIQDTEIKGFARDVGNWELMLDAKGVPSDMPTSVDSTTLGEQLQRRSWVWNYFSEKPDLRDKCFSNILLVQNRLEDLIGYLQRESVVKDFPISIYLSGGFMWREDANDIDLYFILPWGEEYRTIELDELGKKLFGVKLELEVVGIETVKKAISGKLPYSRDVMKLRRRMVALSGAAHIAGVDIYKGSRPNLSDYSIIRDDLLYDAQLVAWPDIKDNSERVEKKKKWRLLEVKAIEKFFGIPSMTQSQYTRYVKEGKEERLVRLVLDYTGEIVDMNVMGDLGKLASILGIKEKANVQGVIVKRLQDELDILRRNPEYGLGIFGAVKEIILVDNLGGLESFVRDRRDAVAVYNNGISLIDIDAFRNDRVLRDVIIHELWESILELVEQNSSVREVASIYQNLREFISLPKEEMAELISFLTIHDNGLASRSYGELLRFVAENDVTGDGLIALAISYVIKEPRYSHLGDSLKMISAGSVKEAEEKMYLAKDIYSDIAKVVTEWKPVIEKTKTAESKSKALMKVKMVISRLLVEKIGFIDELVENGKYIKLDVVELRNDVHIVDWLKRLLENKYFSDGKRSPIVLFSSSSEYTVDAFSTEVSLAKDKFSTEDILQGVEREDVITLLDLGKTTGREIGLEEGLCLPLFYSVFSIYLASRVVLAGGDLKRLKEGDNLTYTTLMSLYKAIFGDEFTDEWLSNLFIGKLPPIGVITKVLNDLREAVIVLEQAA